MQAFKAARDRTAVQAALEQVAEAARATTNIMPSIVDAVREGCTVGEISDIYREVFGVYGDPAWV